MPRPARLVYPDVAHHISQRGNRQAVVFFCDGDRRAYLDLIGEGCRAHGTRWLAWCLMDNHIHLILKLQTQDGLRAVLGPAHSRYLQRISRAQGWKGHLFEARFASYPHLMAAVVYVENKPVKTKLVTRAADWHWSSARAHLSGESDGLTDVAAVGHSIRNWEAYLADGPLAADRDDAIERALRSGRLQGALPPE